MVDEVVFHMGIASVITSGKGGVGKSTAAVGLGRALARRGRRVLLVDCDAGLRSLDRMTGTEESLVFDSSDVVFGRCSPAEAIYPCPGSQGLFLLPAPASGENRVSPGVMRRLVPLLKRYYDHVLLDSPAGVGDGFRSAACAADRALVICSPDPVCVRSASTVRQLLDRLGVADKRLAINRFNDEAFDEAGVYNDLDAIIDASGLRLFGLVPEDISLAAAFQKGEPAREDSPGMMALSRMAARLEGEAVPMPSRL